MVVNRKKIEQKYGLGKYGPVQKYIDSEVIKQMEPYTPYDTGTMHRSAISGTVIGSGKIKYLSPYARYLYYGVIYGPNIPIKENGIIVGWRSPAKKKKYPTGRPLKYNRDKQPKAGKFWFERMKADKKEQLRRGALEVMKRCSKG